MIEYPPRILPVYDTSFLYSCCPSCTGYTQYLENKKIIEGIGDVLHTRMFGRLNGFILFITRKSHLFCVEEDLTTDRIFKFSYNTNFLFLNPKMVSYTMDGIKFPDKPLCIPASFPKKDYSFSIIFGKITSWDQIIDIGKAT